MAWMNGWGISHGSWERLCKGRWCPGVSCCGGQELLSKENGKGTASTHMRLEVWRSCGCLPSAWQKKKNCSPRQEGREAVASAPTPDGKPVFTRSIQTEGLQPVPSPRCYSTRSSQSSYRLFSAGWGQIPLQQKLHYQPTLQQVREQCKDSRARPWHTNMAPGAGIYLQVEMS